MRNVSIKDRATSFAYASTACGDLSLSAVLSTHSTAASHRFEASSLMLSPNDSQGAVCRKAERNSLPATCSI